MKAVLALLLSTFLTLSASAAEPAVAPSPSLPMARCIDINRINDWHIIDSMTTTVRTGRNYYSVKLQAACLQLQHPPGLIFQASPANLSVGDGRICGGPGETVRSRGMPPCGIASVRLIDKATFEQLNSKALVQ